MCKCKIYENYLKRIVECKDNPDPFGYLPALASEALDIPDIEDKTTTDYRGQKRKESKKW